MLCGEGEITIREVLTTPYQGKTIKQDTYHNLNFLSWTREDVISTPGTETRTIIVIIVISATSTIPPLATQLVFA
jgi:hypothetical protein